MKQSPQVCGRWINAIALVAACIAPVEAKRCVGAALAVETAEVWTLDMSLRGRTEAGIALLQPERCGGCGMTANAEERATRMNVGTVFGMTIWDAVIDKNAGVEWRRLMPALERKNVKRLLEGDLMTLGGETCGIRHYKVKGNEITWVSGRGFGKRKVGIITRGDEVGKVSLRHPWLNIGITLEKERSAE